MAKKKEYPKLKNTPITEALIDIHVKSSASMDAKKIFSIYESIKRQYPEKEELIKSKIKVPIRSEEPIQQTKYNIGGYRYKTLDGKQIVQTRLDGFTFNRLRPYISWKEFRKESHRLWQIYKHVTSPELITRVALRYINKLNIPLTGTLEDYLTAPPTVPKELPQSFSGFLMRVIIPEPSISAHAIITQALEHPLNDVAPIILDVEVIEEKDIWETIERLRDFKNKIFFNSITEKLKEKFK